jgi:hypothetical protein
MKYERTNRRGLLSFNFGYDISDVEDRPLPYTRSGALYRPTHLAFVLASSSLENESLPRYKDLAVVKITVSGPKLKKNGVPGNVTTSERIYSYEYDRKLPRWVMPLIEQASKELQEYGQ